MSMCAIPPTPRHWGFTPIGMRRSDGEAWDTQGQYVSAKDWWLLYSLYERQANELRVARCPGHEMVEPSDGVCMHCGQGCWDERLPTDDELRQLGMEHS